MSTILEDFLNAKTDSDVLNLISKLQLELGYIIDWRPVGDRENNLATINLGSDPAAGVVERITNAIDGVMDRKWYELGQPSDVSSPREAAEQWFGIKEGRLTNIKNWNSPEIQDLLSKVKVTLHDSGDVNKPTIDIRDKGTGIKNEDIPYSILSLNASRKLKKLFLAGAFGQGGSTALSYSNYTLIITRSIFEPEKVALTIVRFNPGNIKTDKHGLYEYLVDKRNNLPLEFIIDSEDTFECGTLVRHVSMDLGKYKSVLTAPKNSLYYLAHHYLFDPVIPFTIEEKRNNAVKGQDRPVGGNNRLLDHNKLTEYHDKATLAFRTGKVTIYWWVLTSEGENPTNRITQYTTAAKPIVITYNGQKQGELPNTIIKNDLKFPYLDKYLIIHVSCDELDNESRRQLFPSTRESLRDTSILEELKSLVVKALASDEELYHLNKQRKEKYLKREDSKAIENIRQRLADRFKIHAKVGQKGESPRVTPPEKKRQREALPPIPVVEPPTLFEIINSSPRKVYSGKGFTLRFRTNADPSYFKVNETFRAIVSPNNFGYFLGITSIKNGYGTAYFEANENLPEGDTAEITLEVIPKSAKTLSASIPVQIIPLPQKGGGTGGEVTTPNITPRFVYEGEQFWVDNEWDENSVAKVVRSEDSIDIFVSAGNKNLNSLLQQSLRRKIDVIETIKDMYLEHISFHALLMELDEQKKENQAESIEDETSKDRELSRVSETICDMIGQIMQTLAFDAASAVAHE
ncbi:hypothetical protein LOK74_20440 [Brevibacillus humidisoli]|uniref:hypothetical protein n=1 Tax=Brevibacillus humidisoli TaxID=2895522 RepID=UPI001E59BB79|nr:hypothetical protein [Brevibacillus humidisoli]UFJ40372.1 hypothetical protein LOK74_20440 [Brevibacillus humidisoli]